MYIINQEHIYFFKFHCWIWKNALHCYSNISSDCLEPVICSCSNKSILYTRLCRDVQNRLNNNLSVKQTDVSSKKDLICDALLASYRKNWESITLPKWTKHRLQNVVNSILYNMHQIQKLNKHQIFLSSASI